MQKAFAWFEENKLAYTFHDYKKVGAQIEDLKRWSEKAGWEKARRSRPARAPRALAPVREPPRGRPPAVVA